MNNATTIMKEKIDKANFKEGTNKLISMSTAEILDKDQ